MGKLNLVQRLMVASLILGALTVLGYFTLVSESGPFAAPGHIYVIYFDSIEGIELESRVTVKGVVLGKVMGMEHVPVNHLGLPVEENSPGSIRTRVALAVEMKEPLTFYENYSVALKTSSLLSGKVVSIDPGSARDPHVASLSYPKISVFSFHYLALELSGRSPSEYLRTHNREGTYAYLQGVNVGNPISGFAEVIQDDRASVRRTVQNLEGITRKINTGRGTLGLLLNDDSLRRRAKSLVDEAQIVSRELQTGRNTDREVIPVKGALKFGITVSKAQK